MPLHLEQEIGASAHETRDSISLISYAGCLGLSPAKSAKIHSLNAPRHQWNESLATRVFSSDPTD